MKENIKKTKKKDMEHLFGKMVRFTKEIFLTISEMVMDKCIGQMAGFIKDNGSTMNMQVEVHFFNYLVEEFSQQNEGLIMETERYRNEQI